MKGMKENQILVIIKESGKTPVVEPMFDNDLKAFQKAVGRYIETVTFAEVVIICNEEGRLLGLPANTTVGGVDFCGTIIAAGVKGEEFTSLRAAAVPAVPRLLGGQHENQ